MAGRPPAHLAGKLRRTVHFHAARPLDAGQEWMPRDVLRRLLGIPLTERYLDIGDDTVLLPLPEPVPRASDAPCRLQLAKVRRSALPAIEREGRLTGLAIPLDAGVAEPAHFLLLSDGVVVAEYNHYGARTSHLQQYLGNQLDLDVSFPVYLAGDVFDQLERLRDVRLLELTMRPSAALAQELYGETLAAALDVPERAGEAKRFSIGIAAERDSPSFTQWVKRLLRGLRDEDRLGELATAKVRGYDPDSGAPETVDLLKGKISREIYVDPVNERERRVSPASAYEELGHALESARGDLERGALAG